jgi:hypothetical protein
MPSERIHGLQQLNKRNWKFYHKQFILLELQMDCTNGTLAQNSWLEYEGDLNGWPRIYEVGLPNV